MIRPGGGGDFLCLRDCRRILLSTTLLLSAQFAWAGSEAIFERAAADGSVLLTNVPDNVGDYRQVDESPPQAPETLQPAGVSAARAIAESGQQPDLPANASPGAARGISEGPMGAKLRALYAGARTARQR